DNYIDISIKTNSVDTLTLFLISIKIDNLNNSGEYKRAIAFAELAEGLAKKYGLENSRRAHEIVIYHVNTLIFLREYEAAGMLLSKEIRESANSKDKITLGSMHGLMGRINKEKGDYKG